MESDLAAEVKKLAQRLAEVHDSQTWPPATTIVGDAIRFATEFKGDDNLRRKILDARTELLQRFNSGGDYPEPGLQVLIAAYFLVCSAQVAQDENAYLRFVENGGDSGQLPESEHCH